MTWTAHKCSVKVWR